MCATTLYMFQTDPSHEALADRDAEDRAWDLPPALLQVMSIVNIL